jgi:Fur family peroxide stress response transcriptional regulator
LNDILTILKQNGLKVTPQRLAIINVLQNTKEHPSAETIYKKLSADFPAMSLATVYKTLEMLKNIGLVQELNVGEGSFRYDANVKSHPHLICVSCNRVDDLDEDVLKDLLKEVNKHTDYLLTGQKLYFYGYCPECRKKIKQENNE